MLGALGYGGRVWNWPGLMKLDFGSLLHCKHVGVIAGGYAS